MMAISLLKNYCALLR